MFFAIDTSGSRVEATSGDRALCPVCKTDVLAKCGDLVSHHWAHVSVEDCDLWAEPDTAWHREWQSAVPRERREVVMGSHRADIVTPSGMVVELQRKALSHAEVAEREEFYGRMIWIVDSVDPATKYAEYRKAHQEAWAIVQSGACGLESLPDEPKSGLDLRSKGSHYTFRWKHPRKWVSYPAKPTYLDCGPEIGLLHLKKIHLGPPCGGWGHLKSYEWMRSQLNKKAAA